MYNIPPEALKALEILEKSGFEAYLVGGCVRDLILERNPNDYDITTNALPEQIIDTFKEYKTIPTGIEHGTVTVVINKFQIEITTFRKESTYSDNRHPDSVEFTPSLKEDLVRRDFSMNAVAMDLRQHIIDIYDGIGDMKMGVITCIEEPDKRFEEDALRILRALRFASQLGFGIEKKTSESIHRNAYKLKNISAERINTELEKLINGKNPYPILKEYQDVVKVFMPEYAYTDCILKDEIKSPLIRRSAFFLNIKSVFDIMKRLKYSNRDIDETIILIENFNADVESKADLKILLKNIGESLLRELLNFIEGSCKKDSNIIKASFSMLEEIIENNECYSIAQLEVNGRDLMNLGIKGVAIGQTLNLILEKVICGELENQNSILHEYARNVNKSEE